jgi:hypothetical protein
MTLHKTRLWEVLVRIWYDATHRRPFYDRDPVVEETVSMFPKVAFGSMYTSASRKSLAICS